MTRTLRFVAFLVSLAALVSLLFFVVRVVINDRAFFEAKYTALDHAREMGMQTGELTDATMQMIRYMEGKADSIDIDVNVDDERVSMFNDRERAHMVDVRALYQGFRVFANAIALVFAALLGHYLYALRQLHKGRRAALAVSVPRGFFGASAAFLLLLAAIGAWVLVDFNSFWISFHLLLFTNDLWILDPATSRMINMMPWQLFYDIVLRAAIAFVAAWVGCAIAAGLLLRAERRNTHAV